MTKIKENKTMNEVVSIHHNKDGEIDGVKVQTAKENFVIALRDINEGKHFFTHDEAIAKLEELGLKTMNGIQAAIIFLYLNEINKKMIEVGGEPFAKDWYANISSKYDGDYAYTLHGSYGCLCIHHTNHRIFRCRPIENIKN